MNFENKPELGIGIYTSVEIAHILRLPYQKVWRWMNKYWDDKLGSHYEQNYSWKSNGSRAVGFHTFVEFYVMMQFEEAGVKPRRVLDAHLQLSEMYNTAFPFALKEVIEGIKTDGKQIFLKTKKGTITLDGSKQFNLEFIEIFFKKLEFNDDNLASRYWPLGKEKSVLIDPQRKFGHPVLQNRNIHPETILNHFNAGDPVKYIAHIYDLTDDQVLHALEYCNQAA